MQLYFIKYNICILKLYSYTNNIEYYYDPYTSNDRYPEFEFSLSSLVIHWIVHSEPYTKNPTEYGEYPEGFLGYSPPLIYRLQFIDTHDNICDRIKNKKGIEEVLHYFNYL